MTYDETILLQLAVEAEDIMGDVMLGLNVEEKIKKWREKYDGYMGDDNE